MKKLLSILMISIFLMISIPFVSAQRNIQLNEPFMLYYGEQRAILNDIDDEGRLLRLELSLAGIMPELIEDFGFWRRVTPASASFSHILKRSNDGIFWFWFGVNGIIFQHENDFFEVAEDRYTVEILDIHSGESDTENSVELILRRNNLPVIL